MHRYLFLEHSQFFFFLLKKKKKIDFKNIIKKIKKIIH
jgi:hypothetical protein